MLIGSDRSLRIAYANDLSPYGDVGDRELDGSEMMMQHGFEIP